ncbi:hypothetical protein KDN24_06165 [Bacillus sp. Bva_UNVM-123]|uniref:hypothetical protein n=1 Tax=Bacillus sp. Bva_UNVM-123 TaxID=2829798 RepID=UPI00391F66D9
MSKQVKKTNTDIKFSEIKKIAKETKQTEQYEFEDGATITFYPTFPPTLIEEMIKEISTVLSQEGDELQLSEEMKHKFILFHCIKKFTHLSKQLKANSFAGQLSEMEDVIDSGYFEKIIDEVFLQTEIYKVFDAMSKISSNYLFLEKMTKKMHDEVEKLELKNRDVIEN